MISGNPAFVDIVALIATVLMVFAGVTQKRFRWRTVECPVCHHPRSSCTCRWL
jgi:hypothetical protein